MIPGNMPVMRGFTRQYSGGEVPALFSRPQQLASAPMWSGIVQQALWHVSPGVAGVAAGIPFRTMYSGIPVAYDVPAGRQFGTHQPGIQQLIDHTTLGMPGHIGFTPGASSVWNRIMQTPASTDPMRAYPAAGIHRAIGA